MLGLFRPLFAPRLVIPAHRLQTEGSEGDDVLAFQRLLNKRGRCFEVSTSETGVYDRETREAVQLLQRRALFIRSADGFVGPETARLLHIRLTEDAAR